MEIRPVDLADEHELRAVYDLTTRSELLGREQMPHWSYAEYAGHARSPDSGERQDVYAAYDGPTMVGTATTWTFLLDNTDKVWSVVNVDPGSRRRGVGSALMGQIEDVARADSRTTVMLESHIPQEALADHGHRRFAESLGFGLANVEMVRHLPLPVPDDRVQEWIDSAAERHDGYRIETFVDEIPEHLVESLCVLLGQLAVDAPSGEVTYEEELMTPARFAERLAANRAMGRQTFETLAITLEGQAVAQSTLSVPTDGKTDVDQWGTFVHREHRGRRLGLAVKALNLRSLQAAYPQMRRVTTQNAETNDYMVSINELIGFEPVEASAEFYKEI